MNTSSNASHKLGIAIEVVDLARNVPMRNCEICVDLFEFQGLQRAKMFKRGLCSPVVGSSILSGPEMERMKTSRRDQWQDE